jgi:hypothetical protein
MYIIYKSTNNVVASVNIDSQLPNESPTQMVQRFINNGWVADLPWSNWFEISSEFASYDSDHLIPDWENKTCVLNQEAVTNTLAKYVRIQRDDLLQKCDWSQLPDVPEVIRLSWQPYRQALRDITLQESFPQTVVFPTPPN